MYVTKHTKQKGEKHMENENINEGKHQVRVLVRRWLAQVENIPHDITGTILKETENAIQIEYSENEFPVWLPRSQIKIIELEQTKLKTETTTETFTIEEILESMETTT